MAERNYSSLAGSMTLAVSISDAATSLSLDTTAGLPDAPFTLVVDAGAAGEEVVEVTDLTGLTATVTRGIDSTIPVNHNAGAEVRHMATARDFQEANDHINATEDVHGTTGELVGTDGVQVLTNKTIDGGDNTLQNIPDSAITELAASKLTGDIDADTVNGVTVFVQSATPTANGVGDIWIAV